MQHPPEPPGYGYRGIYINLDRSPARRRSMERQFAALGLMETYRRLPAIDGRTLSPVGPLNAGIVGCFASHAAAVAIAAETDVPVHVAEDDIVLSRHVGSFIRYAAGLGLFERFDIVFLDMWVDPSPPLIEAYLAAFASAGASGPFDCSRLSVIDLRQARIGAAASYVMAPAKAVGVLRLLREELARGPTMPVDHFLSRLTREGTISAAVVVPFLTGVDLEQGAVSQTLTMEEHEHRLFLLLRNAFFVDRDLERVILPGIDRYRQTGRYPGLDRIRDMIAGSVKTAAGSATGPRG